MTDSTFESSVSRRDFLKGVAGVGLSLGALSTPLSLYAQGDSTLDFATSDLPSGIDPHINAADIWQRRAPLIYDNLVWPGFDLQPKPQLAKSWDTPSKTEFIFHLREDVKFHNGADMDAEDVKYSYDRMFEVGYGTGHLPEIDEVTVQDKYTVKFSLAKPAATFPLVLGAKGNAVVPKGTTKTDLQGKAIGTGPFKMTEFEPGKKMVLDRFTDYYNPDIPNVDRIYFEEIPDESSIVAALRTGAVGMTEFADSFNYFKVQGNPRLNNLTAPVNQWNCLDLNLYPEDVPTMDQRVRLAVQLGLDRGEITEISAKGLGDRLGVLPPAMGDWSLPVDELPYQDRDVSKAKSLLKEAGYPQGLPLKIRNISGFPALEKAVAVISEQLAEVGIAVQVETMDIGAWIADWMDSKSRPTLNSWGGFIDPDVGLFNHFHTPPEGMDFRRWNNEKADELLERGRRTYDHQERVKIYNELQRLIAREAVMVPLWAPHRVYSMQKDVTNFKSHPSGFYYGLKYVKKSS